MLFKILSFPSYYAGCDGHIYRDGHRLSERRHTNDYLQVTLSQDGERSTQYVHRLICEAFHGSCPPDKEQCRHLDNDRQNNVPDNVTWATRKENEADKLIFGTTGRGERAANSVLTEAMVIAARDRARQREPIDQIARDLGINDRVMADAVTGRRWGWLAGAVPAFHTRRKFSDDQIREIRARAATTPHPQVAKAFGCSRSAVQQIAARETYAHVDRLQSRPPSGAGG